MSRIEDAWRSRNALACLLWPVSLFYRLVTALRSLAYRVGAFSVYKSALPVIVVGNVSVGGTGKTPLCAYIVTVFEQAGWRPGIVSRGYGGERAEQPRLVMPTDLPAQVGDEPLMLAQQTKVPVCVCVHRARAVQHLASHCDVDIVIADDGLQHLAMSRDAEIVVVDGARGFGNSWLLPAGPMREPAKRLGKADIIAVQAAASMHGSLSEHVNPSVREHLHTNTFGLSLSEAVALDDGRRVSLDTFIGQAVTAMAGIGHPQRFFDALRKLGLQVNGVAKPDHHAYTLADLEGYKSTSILVTSKDAVKLRALGSVPSGVFEVLTTVTVSDDLQQHFVRLEKALRSTNVKIENN